VGVRSDEDLTETQWVWLTCHLLLDEGAEACQQCDVLGLGRYCTDCGAPLHPEPRICQACERETGEGAYCPHCGEPLESAHAVAIAAGTYDWDAWAQSLQPFLGGLTPQEAALLARG
jgi:predicted amidophosphoribosyltransferase